VNRRPARISDLPHNVNGYTRIITDFVQIGIPIRVELDRSFANRILPALRPPSSQDRPLHSAEIHATEFDVSQVGDGEIIDFRQKCVNHYDNIVSTLTGLIISPDGKNASADESEDTSADEGTVESKDEGVDEVEDEGADAVKNAVESKDNVELDQRDAEIEDAVEVTATVEVQGTHQVATSGDVDDAVEITVEVEVEVQSAHQVATPVEGTVEVENAVQVGEESAVEDAADDTAGAVESAVEIEHADVDADKDAVEDAIEVTGADADAVEDAVQDAVKVEGSGEDTEVFEQGVAFHARLGKPTDLMQCFQR
jgi:hypothetical protein